MNKKTIRRQNFISDDMVEDPKDSTRLLQNIHQKLDNSPALNGGFDRLLYKIDGIEKSQIQIVEKVDKIHEAIYHPDDGLFARIATNKTSQIESVSKIEKQVVEISTWKNQFDSDGENQEKETDELRLKVQKLEGSIESIEKVQHVTFSVAKWIGAALGGGIMTLVFKVFYNALKNLP